MKKKLTKTYFLLIGLIISLSSIAQGTDKPILTIQGEDVYASEFMYIYSKNNDNPSFDKDSLDDYMQLFINYKLKVKEARELKYDTIPRLINELAQYRKQLSLPYMTNKEKNEGLIEEAYARTKSEVRASHLLIKIKPNPSPKDTVAAYSKIMQLRSQVVNGADFEKIARSHSEDPSAKINGGDLGYFGALQMVYSFEEAAFETPVGEISMPIRTRFGYHLINVVDKREAKGKMEAAHIFIIANESASAEVQDKAEKKINEIYQLLENGEKFEDLAAKYSEDQSSKNKGGLLEVFGSGARKRMLPKFETAAYQIANDGEYSKPVKTVLGYHIIKRVHHTPVASYEDMYRELKLKVERDVRAESTKEAFLEDLKKQYNYNNHGQKLLPIFYQTIGEEIFAGAWQGLVDHSHDSDILFDFKDKFFTIKDFEQYLISNQTKMARQNMQTFVTGMMERMVTEEITRYEDSQLESKYPEFKSLIREYRDGILVFEIMQDEIWKKASKDTTGIKGYYDAHRNDFTYPVRYRGELYSCKDKATSKAISKLLKQGELSSSEIKQSINQTSALNVDVRSQVFNSETTEAFTITKKNGKTKMKTFKKGVNKAYKNKGTYYLLNVQEVMEPRQREFNEAKGLVTAAYQNELEQKWLEELRKKYSYEIHEEILYGLK